MKPLLHIGIVELVSLPDDQINDIPAKIDTGADKSSIWASNVKLIDGQLSFKFFDTESSFYNSSTVFSTAFRTTTVKNSFGAKEFRYKIKLRVKIGDHILSRWFSLADRSNSKFPILLGKNFLKNKFIVDVSRNNLVGRSSSGKHKILVLTAFPKETSDYFEKVKKLNTIDAEYMCQKYDNLLFCIDGPATSITDALGQDLASYSFTYLKNHSNHEFGFTVAEYLSYKSRSFADLEFRHYLSGSKLSESMRLSCNGLPIPRSYCAVTQLLLTKYDLLVENLGPIFVLKEIKSNKGKFNYLISSRREFEEVLNAASTNQVYIAQKFIRNDGYYRAYITGRQVALTVWRSSIKHINPMKDHLNNPFGSMNATKVELNSVPNEVLMLAMRAADSLDRQLAGVDLVQDNQSKVWYILEVNYDPQILSGSFMEEKVKIIAEYIDRELKQ